MDIWAVKLGFALVGICVATLHILCLRRESQDRQLWLQDMAERSRERAAREQERAERKRKSSGYAPEDFREDGAMY